MRILTGALGLVIAAALAIVVIGGVLAQDGDTTTVTVTLLPNQDDDAGCWLGDLSMPGGDFADFVSEGGGFGTAKDGVLFVPLSQNYQPNSLDCVIEVIASDLTFTSTTGVIPNRNITIAGCDIEDPMSLGTPQVLTCALATGDTMVEVALSLAGLDQVPTGEYTGTLIVNNANGT